jgi:hypothetical protein
MILPREDLAWFRAAPGRAEPFDAERLAASIRRAAARAGQYDWWFAESVAAAIHTFACECKRQRIIDAAEVRAIVETLLRTLGFHEIAGEYTHHRRQTEIWLDDVAAQAGDGFELEFFRQLDTALDVAGHREMETLQVRGLRACVLRLRGDRRWSAGCRRLADEIVVHVRERITRLRPRQAARLSLAVVE